MMAHNEKKDSSSFTANAPSFILFKIRTTGEVEF